MNDDLEKIVRMVNYIYDGETTKITFYDLYSSIYSHIQSNKNKMLYDSICEIMRKRTKKLASFIDDLQEESILETFNKSWKRHTSEITSISQVFIILVERYCIPNKLEGLYQIGTSAWKEYVFDCKEAQNQNVLAKITKVVLDKIDFIRMGETIDYSLLKNIIKMFVGVDLYETFFEEKFLPISKEYFRSKSQKLITENQCGQYLFKVRKIIASELLNIRRFLEESTKEKLLELIYREFLKKHLDNIKTMETGPIAMLRKKQFEELNCVYTLFKAIKENEWLQTTFSEYVSQKGKQIVSKFDTNTKDVQNYHTTQELISLRKDCITFLTKSFENDKEFSIIVDKCFFKFINISSHVAKNLPKFMDYQIRYLKKKSNDEIEKVFNYFLQIFKFTAEKDIIKKYYEFYLSRRLVSSYNFDEELEKQITMKLKNNSWANFTLKMEDMIKNVQVSKEHYQEFTNYQKSIMNKEKTIEFKPWILKQSIWPVSSKANCILPPILKENIGIFEEFYQKQHSGHILKWQLNVGTAEVLYNNVNGRFKKNQLIVSPYQLIVILQFNTLTEEEKPIIKFGTLLENTGISKDTMIGVIATLCSKKHPILKPTNRINFKEIKNQDTFTINEKVQLKQRRIKLVKISQNYVETDKKVNMHWVRKEREVLIESMIMKVMKSRKVFKHQELIIQLTKLVQDKFIPSITMIDQRIRNLIDREYLEKNGNEYKYLA
ncbi:cullin [Anaeramoeba flamelloides]|uniref:Cullin n=1 Tax=Anaeramoeba flamelloides TaxID=1746091 RepID=A0AAV7Z366_9EUKA|nr:cullin [Anaeramoeba flamelloides]KAJ6241650.1 cullin [Anaeramoeba flamelloides]